MRIRKFLLCITLIGTCLLCGCRNINDEKAAQIPPVTGMFDFTILKSGQADAIFLQTENHNVIIDCGEKDDGDKLALLLQEKEVTYVDCVFITHFDKDHVGGFPKVAKSVMAGNIIVPDYDGKKKEYSDFVKIVGENNLNVTRLTEDTFFTLDDVLFEVSVPKRKVYAEGDNDFSLVISVTHGENTFLFAGDAHVERLEEVMKEFDSRYDFLKVPHHGKYNKNTKRFMTSVNPSYSVICDSTKNPAEAETLSVLEQAGSKIYRTANGDVFVLSDGKEIKIFQKK